VLQEWDCVRSASVLVLISRRAVHSPAEKRLSLIGPIQPSGLLGSMVFGEFEIQAVNNDFSASLPLGRILAFSVTIF
jgi:hypothetical protein